MIPAELLPDLLLSLSPPLGLMGSTNRKGANRFCLQLHLHPHSTTVKGGATIQGIRFVQVLDALLHVNAKKHGVTIAEVHEPEANSTAKGTPVLLNEMLQLREASAVHEVTATDGNAPLTHRRRNVAAVYASDVLSDYVKRNVSPNRSAQKAKATSTARPIKLTMPMEVTSPPVSSLPLDSSEEDSQQLLPAASLRSHEEPSKASIPQAKQTCGKQKERPRQGAEQLHSATMPPLDVIRKPSTPSSGQGKVAPPGSSDAPNGPSAVGPWQQPSQRASARPSQRNTPKAAASARRGPRQRSGSKQHEQGTPEAIAKAAAREAAMQRMGLS